MDKNFVCSYYGKSSKVKIKMSSNFVNHIMKISPDLVSLIFLSRGIAEKNGNDDTDPDDVRDVLNQIFVKLCAAKKDNMPDSTYMDVVSRAQTMRDEAKKCMEEAQSYLETLRLLNKKIVESKAKVLKDYQDVITEFKNLLEVDPQDASQTTEQKFNEVLDSVLEEVLKDENTFVLDEEPSALETEDPPRSFGDEILRKSRIGINETNSDFDALFDRNVVYRENGEITVVPGRGSSSELSDDYKRMLESKKL